MPFDFGRMKISEVNVIEPRVFGDNRGFFLEAYKSSDFAQYGIDGPIVQVNHSSSTKGVLRGLHYQLNPMAQAKLVRVIKGSVFDVAVDIRKGSPAFGQWVGEELSEDNRRMLYLPRGFAHGFCVLSDEAEIEYFVWGGEYSPEHDRGILWNDSEINIDWPIKHPILSEKDMNQPLLHIAENNFIYLNE